MRASNPFPLLVALGLLAAACGSAGSSATVDSIAAPASPDCAAGDGNDPDGAAVEQIASTERLDVPSALQDRTNDAFPAPLIDLSRILSGGPPPDGIPPIDDPHFAPAEEIGFLAACEPVVALEIDGDARAYPVQIMTWHEIVNDTVGGVPVSVTFCPLCNSALAYDRRVGDQILDFGTSGSLYQSALVMYDRQTESLWSHFSGQAIVGYLAGTELELFPMQTVSFEAFREAFPEGWVLTRRTGTSRDYGRNPYELYDREGQPAFLFDGEAPADLDEKAKLVGIEHNGDSVAVLHDAVSAAGVIEVEAGGELLVVWQLGGTASALDSSTIANGRDVGATGVFSPVLDGRTLSFARTADGFVDAETGSTWNILGRATDGELAGSALSRVPHVDSFWFAWTAFQPDTRLVS
ncbi:MAG: DUF3179 domain-containing protein [Acidimicrobiales bacterium]|nr:DUF3179 domain-containing protein [Acidimicrobiales bacterium]